MWAKTERILIISICLMILFLCQCGKKTTIPHDLIGVWKTKAPTYADRFFEIKAYEIIFGTGEEKFDAYAITRIETEKDREQKGTLYAIYYKNPTDQEYKFSFYYDLTNQGKIIFKNQQEMIWTKEEANDNKSNEQDS